MITGAVQAENPLAQIPAERNFRIAITGRLCCYDLRDDLFTYPSCTRKPQYTLSDIK